MCSHILYELCTFFLSTNTTQHLDIHKFLIIGAQILFYKSQIKKLTRSHFCSSRWSIFGVKHICAPVSDNVNSWTKSEKYLCSLKTQIDMYKCTNLPHESQILFSSTTTHEWRLHWEIWCKTICTFSLWCKRRVLIWDRLTPQPIRPNVKSNVQSQ